MGLPARTGGGANARTDHGPYGGPEIEPALGRYWAVCGSPY